MNLFFLVLARDERYVDEKIEELKRLHVPYLIVCGRNLNHPNVLYRKPKGKYDAINFGARFVPEYADVVALNDVDTKINNFQTMLQHFKRKEVALVFARVCVKEGPQRLFYVILDFIRRRLLIAASGELMLIRRDVLKKILPIRPCKAEDSYILFKILEFKYKAVFCEECYVETERTKTAEKEEIYKTKTVSGLYQALAYTRAPYLIKLFYALLPFACPLLLVLGKKGYFWVKGILLGLIGFLGGDRTGVWQPTYME
jgi:cellulose synthase/poly-beta-1,6-N-acetylglucosamine synthase-like glycosyltransferase